MFNQYKQVEAMTDFSFKMWSKGLTLWLVCLMAFSGCHNKVQNAPDRYNYQRAFQALTEDNNAEEAIDYCEKDLNDNPKDARTLSLLALAYYSQGQYASALEILDKSVKLWSGKIGDNVINPYHLRANILLELEDTVNALENLDKALRVSDNNKKVRKDQMGVYYSQNNIEKLKEIAQKTIKENPNYSMSYYYLGLAALKEEEWSKTIEYSDKIEKLDKDEIPSANYLRAHASIELGNYEDAANYILKILPTEEFSDYGFLLMQGMTDCPNKFEAMKARLEIQSEKEQNQSYWPYCLGVIYEKKCSFAPAIEYYKAVAELDADRETYERIMVCYSSIGDFKKALHYADEALQIDSTYESVLRVKSELLMVLGRTKESISCASELVALNPENAEAYRNRGDLYQYSGKRDEAIKDYSKALALEPTDSYARIHRGKLLRKQGQESKSIADFKRILKTDSVPNGESMAHYAYFYLNEYKKAKKHMTLVLKADSTAGTYYDAACLYSLMNDSTTSLNYLKTALQKGYRQFRHMAMDSDLDNIRDLSSFNTLMNEYMQKGVETEPAKEDEGETKRVTDEVPFTKEGGVYKVKCKINGLPLHFIFDTGASDVTLSMVEATFMMKNGYLSKKDVVGSQHYMDANGNVSVGTVINLQNVNFGGLHLTNIRASVVRNQKAPLLLGQSILGRLGKIEIDNSKHVINITHSK